MFVLLFWNWAHDCCWCLCHTLKKCVKLIKIRYLYKEEKMWSYLYNSMFLKLVSVCMCASVLTWPDLSFWCSLLWAYHVFADCSRRCVRAGACVSISFGSNVLSEWSHRLTSFWLAASTVAYCRADHLKLARFRRLAGLFQTHSKT